MCSLFGRVSTRFFVRSQSLQCVCPANGSRHFLSILIKITLNSRKANERRKEQIYKKKTENRVKGFPFRSIPIDCMHRAQHNLFVESSFRFCILFDNKLSPKWRSTPFLDQEPNEEQRNGKKLPSLRKQSVKLPKRLQRLQSQRYGKKTWGWQRRRRQCWWRQQPADLQSIPTEDHHIRFAHPLNQKLGKIEHNYRIWNL